MDTAVWQTLMDSASPEYAGGACIDLANQLSHEEDADGLRALYRAAAALNNPDAPYALLQLGHLLDERGDAAGAQAAWQEAIDAGSEDADLLRELIAPSPPPGPEPYPPALPAEFDPRHMLRAGIEVLKHGLPPLPPALAYQMAVPVAFWTSGRCAVVLTLRFSRQRHGPREHAPMALRLVYSRDGETEDGTWTPAEHHHGSNFSHDPIASPGSTRHMGSSLIVYSGGSHTGGATPGHPACVVTGYTVPQVRYLAVIQDEQEERRRLDSHLGAWVVCTERPGPFEIAAIGEDGTVLDTISYPGAPGPSG
jgi:hypothetical protein